MSKETADKRRMRAKKETKGRNPSKDVLGMMAWAVLTTTAGEEVPFGTLLDIYGLRWRIEVISKVWKSHNRLCYERMRERTGRDLGMMKFSNYIAGNPGRVARICARLARGADASDGTCRALRKYCCHDKRKRLIITRSNAACP